MELSKVEKLERTDVIDKILKRSVSSEEQEDIVENLKVYFSEGSDLISISNERDLIGFFVASPYSEDNASVDELILDEFFFDSSKMNNSLEEVLVKGIKSLKKEYKPLKLEVIVTRDIQWMGEVLAANGFLCEVIKLEKILPTEKNLPDVIDLIYDSIPKEKVTDEMIIQVLMEKENEYQTEIIDSADEITALLEKDWSPIMVVLSFEPLDQQISEIIDRSNQLLNWDDFEITYTL